MRKTKMNPKMIAATLAMMTLINTAAPATVYAAEGDNEIKIEQQVETEQAQENNTSSQQEDANSYETEEVDHDTGKAEGTEKEEATQDTEEKTEESSSESDEATDDESDEKSDGTTENDINDDEKNDTLPDVTEQVNPVITNVIEGNYGNPGKILDDITIKTIKYVNDNFIKSLPYIGNIMNSLIGNSLGGEEVQESPLNKRLDSIINKIDMINNTIISSTQKITDQQENIIKNKKIQAMNKAYEDLMTVYKQHRMDFEIAVRTIGEDDNDCHRAEYLKEATDTFDKIYDVQNVNFFNSYKKYCQLITSGSDQIPEFSEFDPHIFAAFHAVTLCGKNGTYAKMQFHDQNRKIIDQVTNTCEYGYAVLNTIMETQIHNQGALNKAYDKAIKELEANKAKASKDQQSVIEDSISILKQKLKNGRTRLNFIIIDKKELDGIKSNVDDYINKEVTSLDKMQRIYAGYRPYDSVTVFHKEYKPETTKDNTTVYPRISDDGKSIEYRDIYRNLRASRTIQDGYTKVDEHKVEVGKIYRIEETSKISKAICSLFGGKSEPEEVKVTRVYTDKHLFFNFIMIEAVNIHTNQKKTYSISDVYTVFEKVVGNFEEVKGN